MSVQGKKQPSLAGLVETFDMSVMARNYEEALITFTKLITIVENTKEGFGGTLKDVIPASEAQATLVASAITSWLCDKEYNLTRPAFNVFTRYKRAISQVFEISGYRGTGHFLRRFGTKRPDGAISLSSAEIPKLFCGLSINALTPEIVDLLLRQKPTLSWPFAMGFLSEQVAWSETAEAARSKILASAEVWKDIPTDAANVVNLGPAYMGCSYAEASHKHDIKRAMNSMARRWLMEHGVTDAKLGEKRRAVKRKPTLLIIAELYDSTHAMHRCYGPAIRSLKDKFKLIYMSPTGKCDPAIEYMFDKVDKTAFSNTNPKVFFDKAKSYRPDVIYYPSVGMRLVSILGSNLRLAPIQIMTYGHPATTYSEYMDYSLIVEGLIGNENTISDKILYWYEKARYEQRGDARPPKANIRQNPNVIRIAVPAWSRKITPEFLSVCQEIQKQSNKPVEFYFYPNGVGALFQAFKRRIEDMLNATVLPRTNYNDYLNSLNTCDIFLSTFPFGATNGILDAGPQGLPIVNLKGDEMHAMNDSEMVSHFNQPEWLSVESTKAYLEAVLRLIANDEERIAISNANAEYDYNVGMMVASDGDCRSFGTAVEVAYKHHEVLKISREKSWAPENLASMLENNKAE